jgi:hypothetical protein
MNRPTQSAALPKLPQVLPNSYLPSLAIGPCAALASLIRRAAMASVVVQPQVAPNSGIAVAQIAFLEWTGADHLRHTKFVALRDDKDPKRIVRET